MIELSQVCTIAVAIITLLKVKAEYDVVELCSTNIIILVVPETDTSWLVIK